MPPLVDVPGQWCVFAFVEIKNVLGGNSFLCSCFIFCFFDRYSIQ